ncbi:MAG: hypothetical protein ACP5UA_04920 [Candidatus Hydrogenedens sp.]
MWDSCKKTYNAHYNQDNVGAKYLLPFRITAIIRHVYPDMSIG